MRDPDRIKRICDKLGALWEKHPDMRFGQLVENLKLKPQEMTFQIEDDVWEGEIDAALIRDGSDRNAFDKTRI